MKLNQPLYAITDPDGRILGDGESLCLYTTPPELDDVERAKKVGGCDAVVRTVVITSTALARPQLTPTLWHVATGLNGPLVTTVTDLMAAMESNAFETTWAEYLRCWVDADRRRDGRFRAGEPSHKRGHAERAHAYDPPHGCR